MSDEFPRQAPLDFAAVVSVADVAVAADKAWLTLNDFGDAGKFLNVPSRLITGRGNIGSIRQIGDAIQELMVGRTATSYIYVQTSGPMAARFYHGCVEVDPTGPDACVLTYTVLYDQASMDPAERESEIERIKARFPEG